MTRDDAAARLTARLAGRLRRRLWLARLALAWESLWPLLWPVAGVGGLFAALALFDALPRLPGPLHAAVLAGFVLAVAALLWRLVRRFHWPDQAQARRRIERDSGLEHRPLAVLSDRIAGDPRDPVARALWQEHRRRVLTAVKALRVALPSPGLAARDPLALRAAVLLLVVVAGAVGYHDAPARFARALLPSLSGGGGVEAVFAQVWLTPPAYTGLPPVFLQYPARPGDPGEADPAISVPAGSAVMALVQGTNSPARLRLGTRTVDFSALGDGSQKVEGNLAAGDGLAIALKARALAIWPVQVLPDQVPTIRFLAPPEADAGGRLGLKLEAGDDYGVTKAWVEVRPAGEPKAAPLVVEMPVPPRRARAAGVTGPSAGASGSIQVISGRQDLTDHPWAGQPVTMTPVAEDGAGQRGIGAPVDAVLPERVFTHPVAKAIIALRRNLGPAPGQIAQAIAGLDRLSAAPDAFGNDTVVFLELRDASARLFHGKDAGRIDAVRDQLWQTALRVEDGNKSVAERNLADAAKALEDALRNGAPPEELDALVNQLQQAMQQYLQALLEDARRKGLEGMPLPDSAETVTPDDLASMLEQMREMAQLGSRDAAQQMLSRLRNMMDTLRAGMQGAMSPQMRQAQQGLKDLSQLTRDQRKLLEQSARQAQQPGGGDPAANQDGAAQQEELRRRLGDAMRSLGESLGDIPPELGAAERAMRDASGKLGRNDPEGGAESQSQALQSLQQGAQAAMQAMSEQMQQGGMGMAGMQNGGGMRRRDPFGRRLPGPMSDDGSVHIPDGAELHKAHDVMEELRRRAAQPDRPRTEREYLQRLLRTF